MPKLQLSDIQIRDPYILTDWDTKQYYLFGTTDKNCWGPGTGFDCYRSIDLVNWEGPFQAFCRSDSFWGTDNYWAPEVHKYKGKYYMFASFKADSVCRGTQVLAADQPEGPYKLHSAIPVTPCDWECLDGTLYIDKKGTPWMVFCHEWCQIHDGSMCVVQLAGDLRSVIGDPITLFHASEAPWRDKGNEKGPYVTDGPFLFTSTTGSLLMLWSSFGNNGYAMGLAKSETGEITGPWVQLETPLYHENGGHGMIFRTFDNKLMLILHSPNETPNEHAHFYEIKEENGTLVRA